MRSLHLTILCTLSLMAGMARGTDVFDVNAPFQPRAPLDPRKSGKSQTSSAEDRELNSEFKGLIHMGLKKYAAQRWPGREMADCRTLTAGGFCQACELQMGHASAVYYFYKEAGECTLQQMDALFPTSDLETLALLRRTAQSLFGESGRRAEKSASAEPGWDGSGPGWRWDSGGEIGFLYNDRDQASSDGNGPIRFQWRKPPLSRR